MKKSTYIIDTNFILRYLLEDNKAQYMHTKKFFDSVRSGDIKATMKESVFTEVIFVLSSYYKVPRDTISKTLSSFLLYKGIIMHDKDVLLEALNIYHSTKLHIVDSLLAAEHFLKHQDLMTFDGELALYIEKIESGDTIS